MLNSPLEVTTMGGKDKIDPASTYVLDDDETKSFEQLVELLDADGTAELEAPEAETLDQEDPPRKVAR